MNNATDNLPPEAEAKWRIEMLGGFRVHRKNQGEASETVFRTRKTAALLAFLAFHPGAHWREHLSAVLWPDAPTETGRNNLRVALHALRLALSTGGEDSPIRADRHSVELLGARFSSDVGEFEELVNRAARATASGRVRALEGAVALFRGPLLSGFYEDWIGVEAARLEDLFFRSLDSLIGALESEGLLERALKLADQGARLAPNRPDNKRALERLRARLRGQSVSPTSAPVRHQFAAPGGGTAQNTQTGATLPLPLSRFFGREDEVAHLQDLVSDPSVRLVTLCGVGGVGKTRLAIEVARALDARRAGSVAWIGLASLRDADLLPETLCQALGVEVKPGEDALLTLLRSVGNAPETWILDNCEKLLPGLVATIQTLLEGAPGLSILATSRVPLRLAGEHQLRVHALPVPPAEAPDSQLNLGELNRHPSVRLFVDRAKATRSEFQLSPGNAASVARLVRALDGHALAIELVAARCAFLSPGQLLGELELQAKDGSVGGGALDVRRAGAASESAPERHRSLRAVWNSSFHALPEAEQLVLARCSVFRGGYSWEAALHVCGDEPDSPLVVEALQELCAASLVVAVEDPNDGATRFFLPDTLRAYASEKLFAWRASDEEISEVARARARHAAFYRDLVTSAVGRGGQGGAWVARMDAEVDNFRAVLDRAFHPEADQEAFEAGLWLVGKLWWFWPRAHLEEGRKRLNDLLGETEAGRRANPALWSDQLKTARAHALGCAGLLALRAGDFRNAKTRLDSALQAWRELDDRAGIASVLNVLGGLAHAQHDLPRALELYGESLRRSRENGDKRPIAIALCALAGVQEEDGQSAPARALCDEALPLWRELDDRGGVAWVFQILAKVALRNGDFARSRELLEESLRVRQSLDSRAGVATSLGALGDLAGAQGDLIKARKLWRECLAIRRRLGLKPDVAGALERLAALEDEAGSPDAAQLWREAFAARRNLDDEAGIERTLAHLRAKGAPKGVALEEMDF